MAHARSSRRSNRLWLVLGVLAVALALLLMSQQAMAETVGGFVAGLWLEVMNFLMGVVGMFFGG